MEEIQNEDERTVNKVQDFLSNLILLVYVGIMLIYKGMGYSFFMAAWKALVFVTVLFLMAFTLWVIYKWVQREAEINQVQEPEEQPSEEQTVMNEQP